MNDHVWCVNVGRLTKSIYVCIPIGIVCVDDCQMLDIEHISHVDDDWNGVSMVGRAVIRFERNRQDRT